MKNYLKILPLIFASLLLAACGSTGGTKGGAAVENLGQQGKAGAQASGAQGQGSYQGNPLDNPASLLSKRSIYFDFNSSDVQSQYYALISAHGAYLAAHPNMKVVLEGNTDERGTREYNLGLGERRAEAVRKLLLAQGASPDQLKTISFGKERPYASGHDESAWRLNRRVDIVYNGQLIVTPPVSSDNGQGTGQGPSQGGGQGAGQSPYQGGGGGGQGMGQ
ncbi:MAG: peptidoglycan-associated lipoprotein Pal [Gammaproteobacteria bacterium]|nr:peptidoglycan-associated lipoprotein Pal [Gammaproteobacteria bacterium]